MILANLSNASLADWASLATIVGVPIGIFAALFAGLQLKRTLVVERGKFLLELERMLAEHNVVHLRLRPGGDWWSPTNVTTRSVQGPMSASDFAAVEDYMGFFEHCEILIRTGCIDLTAFKKLFGYRIANIIANPLIAYYKLHKERKDWGDFLSLADRLKLNVPVPEENEIKRIHAMKASDEHSRSSSN
jgi:hypothetical protein